MAPYSSQHFGRVCLILALLFASKVNAQITYGSSHPMGSMILDFNYGSNDHCMDVDAEGNLYVFNEVYDTTDLDPGPDSVMVYPCAGQCLNGFVAKYDPQGQFLWSVQLNGALSYLMVTDVAVDFEIGVTAVVGFYRGPLDVDPAPGPTLPSQTDHNGFIVLYDLNGTYLSSISLGTIQGTSDMWTVIFDTDHQLVIGGHFFGTVDFDPSGTFNLTGNNTPFLAKYSIPLDLVWAFEFDDATGHVWDLDLTPNGDLIVSGGMKGGNVDVDPGAAHSGTNAGVIRGNSFVARYGPGALPVFQWITLISTSNENHVKSVDEDGGLFIEGVYSVHQGANGMDLDPGPGVNRLPVFSYWTDYRFIAKYSPTGQYQWGYGLRESAFSGGYGGVYAGHGVAVVAGTFDPAEEGILYFDQDTVAAGPVCDDYFGSNTYLFSFDNATGALLQPLVVENYCDNSSTLAGMEGTADGTLITFGYYYDGLDPAFTLGEDPLPLDQSCYTARYNAELSTSLFGTSGISTEQLDQVVGDVRVYDAQGRFVHVITGMQGMRQGLLVLQGMDLPQGVYTVVGINAEEKPVTTRWCSVR